MAGVVVVGSKKSGGTTKCRCGYSFLLLATIASRIACGYDCRRCQLGWCKTNPRPFSLFLHKWMRVRGAVAAIIMCYHCRRDTEEIRSCEDNVVPAILGSITGQVAYVVVGISEGYILHINGVYFACCL
jgi:hypothetical protein